MLKVQNLKVKVQNKLILNRINLQINHGEIVALMGPNGSGKSSLAHTLVGNPNYQVIKGEISLDNKIITRLKPNERAKLGLFLAWQNPVAVRGVSAEQILRTVVLNCRQRGCQTVCDFRKELFQEAQKLKINQELLFRDINVNFSGGEKKKGELLQLLILKPKYAILDEIDSGLDIDALKLITKKISELRRKTKTGILLITHYPRIFQFLKPDKVLVMKAGRIVARGDQELVRKIEREGYESIK